MQHREHRELLQKAHPSGEWADVGSGSGAFTLALRDLAGPEVKIYSVDRDASALWRQQQAFDSRFPDTHIHYIVQDFRQPLNLPLLDGIMMANSLHFIPYPEQIPLLLQLQSHLKPNGQLVLVEYNSDTGNQWVPYPFSFLTLGRMAEKLALGQPQLLGTIPSTFMHELYAASIKKSAILS